MKILLLGAPGSGKGSAANLLERHHGFLQFSTGDLFRNLSKNDTPIAREVDRIIKSGQLVPDDMTNELVKLEVLKLLKTSDKLILDGFPRNLNQVAFLEGFFRLDQVFLLNAELDVLVKRIVNRLNCPTCKTPWNKLTNPPKRQWYCDLDGSLLYQREDDREETFMKRYQIYQEKTAPLIDHYSQKQLLTSLPSLETAAIVTLIVEKLSDISNNVI